MTIETIETIETAETADTAETTDPVIHDGGSAFAVMPVVDYESCFCLFSRLREAKTIVELSAAYQLLFQYPR